MIAKNLLITMPLTLFVMVTFFIRPDNPSAYVLYSIMSTSFIVLIFLFRKRLDKTRNVEALGYLFVTSKLFLTSILAFIGALFSMLFGSGVRFFEYLNYLLIAIGSFVFSVAFLKVIFLTLKKGALVR